MAIPRVFISSTYRDLRHIRERLSLAIRNLGYEPVISEAGDVHYNPDANTEQACLAEVSRCQLFVLIIGGRYGHVVGDSKTSVTHNEYLASIEYSLPGIAVVDQQILAHYHTYRNNRENEEIDANKIKYPDIEDVRVFDLMDEVMRRQSNNALVPFRDIADIEQYLKKQWAGMMYDFLANRSERQKVSDTLAELKVMNERIAEVSDLIAKKVDVDPRAIMAAKMDAVYKTSLFYELLSMMLKDKEAELPDATAILESETLEDALHRVGMEYSIEKRKDSVLETVRRTTETLKWGVGRLRAQGQPILTLEFSRIRKHLLSLSGELEAQ